MSKCKHSSFFMTIDGQLQCDECCEETEDIIYELQKENAELLRKYEQLEAHNAVLRQALLTFCKRVERSEVRSRKTYSQFISLLRETPAESAEKVQRLVDALRNIVKSGTGYDDEIGGVVKTQEAVIASAALAEWEGLK